MPVLKPKYWTVLLLCLALLLLAGCAGVPQAPGQSAPARRFPADSTEVTAVLEASELSELDDLSQLQRVDLSGSTCYAEIAAWAAAHPNVSVRYTVALPDGRTVDNSAASLDLSGLSSENAGKTLPLLRYLPALQSVDLGGQGANDLTPENVLDFMSAYPNVNFSYGLSLQGRALTLDETSLDLSSASNSEIEALLPWLPYMNQMQKINLGEGGEAESSRIPWDTVGAIRRACPWSELDYSFTLFGRALTLNETYLDLNHVNMDDQGALVKAVTVCMPHLQTLDMDFCGVDNEHMAAIRDALPNTDVIWRIWFGTGYSVRTDVEKILASNPDKAGFLDYEAAKPLQYCTKCKYLDLGHNHKLESIDFVRYMPDLEVVILAMAAWSDCSPLAECPKLEYAELQTTALNDLRPLSKLKNLAHLNICYDFALTSIEPLYEMHSLQRLWIGCLTPIPPEQVAEFKRLNPQCTVDLESVDPTQTYWRYLGFDDYGVAIFDPRYLLLRQQFGYDDGFFAYSYTENDPLYYPHD